MQVDTGRSGVFLYITIALLIILQKLWQLKSWRASFPNIILISLDGMEKKKQNNFLSYPWHRGNYVNKFYTDFRSIKDIAEKFSSVKKLLLCLLKYFHYIIVCTYFLIVTLQSCQNKYWVPIIYSRTVNFFFI
jgi:hypothetical protein